MARNLTVKNLLPKNDYVQFSTEAAQWETPSCSWPYPATDNVIRDSGS